MPEPIYMNARMLTTLARQSVEEAGDTQEDASKKIGVSRSVVTRALNHNEDAPTRRMGTVRKILEVYTDYVIGEEPMWPVQTKEDKEAIENAPHPAEFLEDVE